MNHRTLPLLALLTCSLFLNTRAQTADLSQPIAGETQTAPYQITERTQDSSLYRKITSSLDERGDSILVTNQFTLLENGLNYQDPATGQWRESEDLIESFPDGAIARRGPHKAIFAHELNSQTVFDIQTSDAKRIRGGVRAIQLTDTTAGRTINLATVKNSVTAQLLPPNSILWADAFDGLKADVLINWKHGGWSHDVLLREQPELPPGWDPATTRLEVLTEFIVDAEPDIRKSAAAEGQPELQDHTVIDFGRMALVVGKAYSVSEGNAFRIGGDLQSDGAPVQKQWQRTPDDRHFLIETLPWQTASKAMNDLPVRQQAAKATGPTNKNFARTWPKTPAVLKTRKPVLVVAADYKARGYLMDFTILTGPGPLTLSSGQTYYIKNSFSMGSTLTVQANATVKFKNNTYLLVYGQVVFPSTGQKAVFTSRNDDSVGDIIRKVANETDSDGDPSSHRANPALWLYYDNWDVTIQNARFRWAKVGVRIDRNTYTATQAVNNCFFESITGTGSAGIAGSGYNVSNLKKCKVDYPGPAMTLDCTGIENDWAGDQNWELTNPAEGGWPTLTNPGRPRIEGFAGATSVNAGSSIDLYVDIRQNVGETRDASYTIEIYRMGWYGGAGARKMTWYDSGTGSTKALAKTSPSLPQPIPRLDDAAHGYVVDCLAPTANGSPQDTWSVSYTLNVPSWWLSGVYLAKLTGSGSGKQSYIIFTVREDTRGSDLYFQTSVTTWQAYNPWGGNSLYGYPYCVYCDTTEILPRPSRCPGYGGSNVSFNRPYAGPYVPNSTSMCNSGLAYGTGAGEFLVQINLDAGPGWEYNALRWIERQGYDVTYCTDLDTHNGSLLNKSTKAFLSVGHDEYWSTEMRSNVKTARDRSTNPINLMFLGSNISYWRIHMAAGNRSFTCAKDFDVDRWRDDGDPEISMIGVQFFFNSLHPDPVYNPTCAIKLSHPSSGLWPSDYNGINGGMWPFDYTGIAAGNNQELPGLLGYELDGCWLDENGLNTACPGYEGATCPNWWITGQQYGTLPLADSTFKIHYYDGQYAGLTCMNGHSYATIYTSALGGHGKVFATGSMQWNWGLDNFGYNTHGFAPSYVSASAQQLTHNVIRKFTGNATSPK